MASSTDCIGMLLINGTRMTIQLQDNHDDNNDLVQGLNMGSLQPGATLAWIPFLVTPSAHMGLS